MPPAKKKPAAVKEGSAPEVKASAPAAVKGNAALVSRLTATLAALDKDNKDVAVVGDSNTIKLLGVVPTGSPTLDAAIGRGGYPFGRIVVLSGGEGTGKTTHGLHAIANVQKMGGVGVYVDLENKLDIGYAESIGVDLSQMLVLRPGWAERTFELVGRFIAGVPKGGDIPIVVVLDSLNAMVPKAVFDSEDYETSGGMGAQARIFSAAVPKLVQALGGRRIVMLVISQPRDKITPGGSYKEKITGGSTWKFYAAVAIDMKKDKDVKVTVGGVEAGQTIEANLIKNQVAPPFKKARYQIVWGQGIDYHQALLEQSAKWGILDIGGAGWGECREVDELQPPHKEACASLVPRTPLSEPCDCEWEPTKVKWQGLDGKRGFKALCQERPDILASIEAQVLSHYK